MEDKLHELGTQLARLRKRPCLFFVCPYISRAGLPDWAKAVDSCGDGEAVDVVVHGPGGDPDAAYLFAREVGRKFNDITAYIPAQAKSGATIFSLVASELVLGRFGELGPIDVQAVEAQPGEFSDYRSCLERFKALEQLQRHALETFEFVVGLTLDQDLNVLDACSVAADLTGRLMAPLYSQLKPEKIGQSARFLELAEIYAHRLVRRHQPGVEDIKAVGIVRHLGRAYPTHGVVIDVEELVEIGLNARAPVDPEEARIVSDLATILSVYDGTFLCSVKEPAGPVAVPQSGNEAAS